LKFKNSKNGNHENRVCRTAVGFDYPMAFAGRNTREKC
jgi:hypothetical protein